MTENKQASGKILCLEGLRGLCALSVLICHVVHDSIGYRTSHESYFPGYFWAFIGYFANIGVLLFFVLSGFVIEYTTQKPFSWGEAKKYLARRFIRIYPIYILVLIFSFSLSDSPSDTWLRFSGNALFLQTWLVNCLANNGVMWTLHLEVAFYLLYLLVWRFKSRVNYLLFGTALCALASPFVESHLLRIFGYLFLWLAGLKLAMDYLEKPKLEAFQKSDWKWFWAALLSAIGYTTINVIQVVLKPFWIYGTGYLSLVSVVVISGCLMTIISVPLGLRIRMLYKFSVILSFVACAGAIVHSLIYHRWADFHEYPLASAYLLLAMVGFVWGGNVSAQRILERLTWLGAISYALYIVQNPIENFVFSRTPISWGVFSWWSINVMVVAMTFATSVFLENIYQPWIGLRLKKMLLSRN